MEEEVRLDFYHFCRVSVWIIPWLSCSTAGKEYLPGKKIGLRPKLLGFQQNCIKEGKELRGCFKPSIVETMKCRYVLWISLLMLGEIIKFKLLLLFDLQRCADGRGSTLTCIFCVFNLITIT